MAVYATTQDLVNLGVQPNVIAKLAPSQVAAILQSASDEADSFGRGRWGYNALPLLAWDTGWTRAVAKLAAFEVIRVGGVNPESQDYKLARIGWDDAREYFNGVQRQQVHPQVTLAPAGTALPGQQQPFVMTSSVVNVATGARARNRGW